MKILAFGGSNSKHSINRKLAHYTASLFKSAEVELLDINDYPLPLFSVDIEKEIGQSPDAVKAFLNKIASADLLIISLAENNSSFNVGFKNLFDWSSRANPKQFQSKKMLLMATSPGGRGGSSVLETAKSIFPRHGAEVLATFSLPNFTIHFREGTGIIDLELKDVLTQIVQDIEEQFQ